MDKRFRRELCHGNYIHGLPIGDKIEMDADTILALATLIVGFISSTITLLVRAKLIEQGRDIKELKAQKTSLSDGD